MFLRYRPSSYRSALCLTDKHSSSLGSRFSIPPLSRSSSHGRLPYNLGHTGAQISQSSSYFDHSPPRYRQTTRRTQHQQRQVPFLLAKLPPFAAGAGTANTRRQSPLQSGTEGLEPLKLSVRSGVDLYRDKMFQDSNAQSWQDGARGQSLQQQGQQQQQQKFANKPLPGIHPRAVSSENGTGSGDQKLASFNSNYSSTNFQPAHIDPSSHASGTKDPRVFGRANSSTGLTPSSTLGNYIPPPQKPLPCLPVGHPYRPTTTPNLNSSLQSSNGLQGNNRFQPSLAPSFPARHSSGMARSATVPSNSNSNSGGGGGAFHPSASGPGRPGLTHSSNSGNSAASFNLGRFGLSGSAKSHPQSSNLSSIPEPSKFQSLQHQHPPPPSLPSRESSMQPNATPAPATNAGFEEDYFDDDFDFEDPSLLELISGKKTDPATTKAASAETAVRNVSPPRQGRSPFVGESPQKSKANIVSATSYIPASVGKLEVSQPSKTTLESTGPPVAPLEPELVPKVPLTPSPSFERPSNSAALQSSPPLANVTAVNNQASPDAHRQPALSTSHSPSKSPYFSRQSATYGAHAVPEFDRPLPEPPGSGHTRAPSRVGYVGQKRESLTTTPQKDDKPAAASPETEGEIGVSFNSPLPRTLPPQPSPLAKFKATSSFIDATSEEPLPWSSSPAEHFRARSTYTTIPPVPMPELSRPGDRMEVIEEEGHEEMRNITGVEEGDADALQQAPRAKRKRKLPWASDSAREQSSSSASLGASTTAHQSVSVPASKKETSKKPTAGVSADGPFESASRAVEKDSFLWASTTTAAVNAQKRLLREANKKSMMKVNGAPAESLLGARKVDRVGSLFLSEEQHHVLKLVVDKKQSVFFTGSAGTGKSVLLREIISALRKKYGREADRIAVTASTGLAACNIGGVTLHSFSGIGLGKEPPAQLVKKIKRNAKAKLRWMRTKVLIIDEVSMVDAELFDKLEEVARILRNNGRPFGGIQLVVTGDFFQLPPVPEGGREARFAFDAGSWNTSIDHTIGLHYVFRQKDPVFADMLNQMREGRMTPDTIGRFYELQRPLEFNDHIAATELFPTRREVDMANASRMNQLPGKTHSFEAHDGGTMTDPAMRTKLLENCMAPLVLSLKKGSQVMLIKNFDEMLVNGSIGKVRGFMTPAMWNFVCESNYKPERKTDGDASKQAGVDNDDDNDDEELEFPDEAELLDKATQGKPKKIVAALINAASSSEALPLVRFSLQDGTSRDLLCTRETWNIEQPNGEIQASRSQIPLILAWALSIHKAQGQTLDRVKVDLGRVFERGQAYVALSRATSMAGLQVMRFNPQRVVVHDRVREFYASLSRFEMKGKAEGAKGAVGAGGEPGPQDREEATSTESDTDGTGGGGGGGEPVRPNSRQKGKGAGPKEDPTGRGKPLLTAGQLRAAMVKKQAMTNFFRPQD